MPGPELEDSKQALDAAFYSEAEALAAGKRLREEAAEAIETLARATGIGDEGLLQRIADIGIRADTLAAMTLIPLLEVAWADDVMDEKEKTAVLSGAVSTGIEEGSPSHVLLRIWLEDRPAPGMFKVWRDLTAALGGELTDEEREHFKEKIVGRARDVALAAGSFLGFGNNISPEEAAILTELEEVFDASASS